MKDSDFITVFNAADVRYEHWWPIALGLSFIMFGAFLPRLIDAGMMRSSRPIPKGFCAFFLGFAILWTTIVLISNLSSYLVARETLMSGRAGYVEGKVQDFVPMPYQDHSMESFNVKGVAFRYSDYIEGSGFNNTASHGGPIRQDLYVRIWYSGNNILKLEIPKDEKTLAANSRLASVRLPWITFKTFLILWIGLGVGGQLLISRLSNAGLKKTCSNLLALVLGLSFFVFVSVQMSSVKSPLFAFVYGPAIALITWMNIRNTYFCDHCGKRSMSSKWFGSTYYCPHCGTKLR